MNVKKSDLENAIELIAGIFHSRERGVAGEQLDEDAAHAPQVWREEKRTLEYKERVPFGSCKQYPRATSTSWSRVAPREAGTRE